MMRRVTVLRASCAWAGQKVGVRISSLRGTRQRRPAAGGRCVCVVVWETRGQHRRSSPKNQCGHFRHVTPRPSGEVVEEEKAE